MPDGTLLITGATGLIGSHVAEAAAAAGYRLRALVRAQSPGRELLTGLGAELVTGDLEDPDAVRQAVRGVRWIVHCAAQVGDWGPAAAYRRLNVDALSGLLGAARAEASLTRFVALSSLGVYEPRDHFGTDESVPAWTRGVDPYTRTKALAEQEVLRAAAAGLPAVLLRPGFVYGARDRHVLPGLLAALRRGLFTYVGSGQQLLDNTYVKNLTAAVLAALTRPHLVGEVINVTDAPLVSRIEFVSTVARLAGYPEPRAHVPRPVARVAAVAADRVARLLRAPAPPLLSRGRYKFLALHLEFSIAKAGRLLGYQPRYGFADGMAEAMAWFTAEGLV